jgi:hypothetical protein
MKNAIITFIVLLFVTSTMASCDNENKEMVCKPEEFNHLVLEIDQRKSVLRKISSLAAKAHLKQAQNRCRVIAEACGIPVDQCD